ncbi:MAG: ACP S-malonyltransferase [Firmicutes bacterium]|nr:ACP S-malonyltransferase [Bacillota bacterium]
MGKVAWVFPGQGSQRLGMGRDVVENMPGAKEFFATGSDILGYDLARLCWEGPEERLRQTKYTQPALLVVSSMLAHILRSHGLKPHAVAGHSLGEYSALVAAGSLPFAEAVALVARRGQLMQEAVPYGQGAMGVLLGLDYETTLKICAEAAQGEVVEPANLNSSQQVVISGTRSAVERAMALGRERGARRVLELAVSGPFHSSLMRPAAERFAGDLRKIQWVNPLVPLVANVTAGYVTGADDIPRLLTQQLYMPVRWEETVLRLVDGGVEHFVEIGPGKVLAGLIKRISPKVSVVTCGDMESLEKVLEMGKGDIVL